MSTQKVNLVNANQLAEMLAISVRHVWRMKSSGKLPAPIKMGSCVRWKLQHINDWISMGCPSLEDFENRKIAKRVR